ncbi:MAG: hypothetical protein Q9162_002367 [Coniocarpon cinnabarinum]
MTTRPAPVPATPRVISPTPSAEGSSEGYFPPTTRSASKRQHSDRPQPLTPSSNPSNDSDQNSDPDEARRSRSRSRSVPRRASNRNLRRPAGKLTPKDSANALNGAPKTPNGTVPPNGYLSPFSASPFGSRSPSPLGLIPLHKNWRRAIHKHEIPRKILHVSIGFVVLALYARGLQTSQIHGPLLYALVPITSVDILRRNWPPFNRVYVRVMGAFMREAEVHDKYNGVIWYLLGAWAATRFFPKDVGVMSIILLSWCDTAASTVGRWLGRYTPRVRKGKSLAGSLAAFTVGVTSAALFWGLWAPWCESKGVESEGANAFAFQGVLSLPQRISGMLGWTQQETEIGGGVAVGVMSVVAGLVASVAEAIDVGGLDDNVTIPILCGIGLMGFLKVFGSA